MSLDPTAIKIDTIALAGPAFMLLILNWALFAVLSLQVYLYSQAFPNDLSTLKTLVFGVYLLEMAQTILLTDTCWKFFVSGFGNVAGLDEIGTTWLSVCCIGGLVALLVQWFYAYRIAIISQKRVISAFIIFLSLTSFAGALASAYYTKLGVLFSNLLLDQRRAFTVLGLWGGTGSLCDVAIAVCMCYYLHRHSHNEYGVSSRTQALVSKLIRLTIETGALTGKWSFYLAEGSILTLDLVAASISILTLVLFCAPSFKNTTYFEAPLSALAKLYSTTMMAVLNSRMKLGIISESTTWREDEMVFAGPRSRAMNSVTPSDGHLPIAFTIKEEAITSGEP